MYTQVLNSLTEDEWKANRLPPVTSVQPKPNSQLPDLVNPSFVPTAYVVGEAPGDQGHVVGEASGQVQSANVDDVLYDERNQCHPECFPGLGGVLHCVYDVQVDAVEPVMDNTPASVSTVVIARENPIPVPPPPPQVGSTPGGETPPLAARLI